MMRNRGVFCLTTIGFAFCISFGLFEPATAGPLFPNVLAIPGTSGTVQLQHDADNNPITPNQYYGDIEYAVFTAANFALVFPGEDTPNGGVAAGEFVYAYQVYNAGFRGDITQFSAGLADIGPPAFPFHYGDGFDDNESVVAGDQDFIAGTGLAPSFTQVTASAIHAPSGSSVRYNFVSPRLVSGQASAVLFYTSPWAPRWENGSTTTGQGQSRIPGPEEGRLQPFVPEPSSLALAIFAIAAGSLPRVGRGLRH